MVDGSFYSSFSSGIATRLLDTVNAISTTNSTTTEKLADSMKVVFNRDLISNAHTRLSTRNNFYNFDIQGTKIVNNGSVTKSCPENNDIKKVNAKFQHPHMRFIKEERNEFDFAIDSMPDELKLPETIDSKSEKIDRDGNYIHELFYIKNSFSYSSNLFKDFIKSRGLAPINYKRDLYKFDENIIKKYKIEKMVDARKAPAIIRRNCVVLSKSKQETKAKKLLLNYVGDKEFKRYMKYGYVVINAHGFSWRIPGEKSIISNVQQFKNSLLVQEYCVHFKDNLIPPTDACIMRMALVNGGINLLKEKSNIYEKNINMKKIDTIKKNNKEITLLESFMQFKKIEKQSLSFLNIKNNGLETINV